MTFYKVRYLLILFILFFIASLVFIISGLANGLSMDNASSIKNSNAESFFLDNDSENRIDRSRIMMSEISEDDFSANLQPLSISMTSIGKEKSDKDIEVTLIAINPASFLEPITKEGKGFSDNKVNEVVLDDSLKQEGIKIGHKVKDEKSGVWLEVVGFTNNQTFSHTPVAHITLDTWKKINNEPFYSAIVVKNNSHSMVDFSNKVNDGVWIEKDLIVKGIPGYEAEQNSLFMMLAFLIVIAVFVLAAFFYIITIQKSNQFGILKAIGAKTVFLCKSTLLQVVILTIISLIAAVGFTWGIFMVLPEDIPFLFDPIQIAKFSGIIAIVSIFGSLLSTYNIIQADPIQAMGRME